jgi:hypothetical protein
MGHGVTGFRAQGKTKSHTLDPEPRTLVVVLDNT